VRTATPEPAAERPAASVRSQQNLAEPVRIVIDSINMDRSLVSVGLDENRVPIVPNHDAAWYNLSAPPGAGDNVVLWGHVLRFQYAPEIPAPFARVDELEPGATITLYNAEGEPHYYTVSDQLWVKPEQVEFILPHGSERLTLVSCIGNEIIVNGSLQLTHRLITIATPAR
jgi:sortase (surface protein transpeptidase)